MSLHCRNLSLGIALALAFEGLGAYPNMTGGLPFKVTMIRGRCWCFCDFCYVQKNLRETSCSVVLSMHNTRPDTICNKGIYYFVGVGWSYQVGDACMASLRDKHRSLLRQIRKEYECLYIILRTHTLVPKELAMLTLQACHRIRSRSLLPDNAC
jgi:hypothetical protein